MVNFGIPILIGVLLLGFFVVSTQNTWYVNTSPNVQSSSDGCLIKISYGRTVPYGISELILQNSHKVRWDFGGQEYSSSDYNCHFSKCSLSNIYCSDENPEAVRLEDRYKGKTVDARCEGDYKVTYFYDYGPLFQQYPGRFSGGTANIEYYCVLDNPSCKTKYSSNTETSVTQPVPVSDPSLWDKVRLWLIQVQTWIKRLFSWV